MQLALDHPAKFAGSHKLPFLLVVTDEPANSTANDATFPVRAENRNEPPAQAAIPYYPAGVDEPAQSLPPAPDYAQLYAEERCRADALEQRLTNAMVLLHETAGERDRWYSQAQRALSLIDSLQRQIDALRRPLRVITPRRRRRRRFFGLF